jgi:hypothetical protein
MTRIEGRRRLLAETSVPGQALCEDGKAQIDEDEMDRTVRWFGGDRVGLRID